MAYNKFSISFVLYS